MPDTTAPFRIWIAGTNEWLPGPSFNTLDLALASAHKLAASGEVAIELPTRHWHTFNENGEQFLGPAHVAPPTQPLARGSQTNLAERANAVIADSSDSKAYKLSIGRVRTVKAVASAAPNRISSTHISTPHTIESQEVEASVPVAQGTGETYAPTPRTGRERRDTKRYEAALILGDPACSIGGRRTKIVDISEAGLKVAVPAGARINVGARVTLVFSGRHGFFELATNACWVHGGFAGVKVDNVGSNVVGRMFMRKMIAKWLDRERRRARRK